MLLQLMRRLHTTVVFRSVDTSLLAKLRKKTGYTISNCKKALEMHNNDTTKAESWLNEQAQAMGWEKAAKLADREASQGLIAIKFDKHHGALVELNCETDFVAKNENFQKMIEEAANACFKFAHTHNQAKGPLTKMSLDNEQLTSLVGSERKSLGERLALMIGSLGENAKLRRAECWQTNTEDIKIAGYTHPTSSNPTDFSAGKYGAILAYKQSEDTQDIGRQLCQHIVGMNPKRIGHPDSDTPAKDSDDEVCLIYQEYLLNPEVTIQEVLAEHKLEIVDYKRFSLGEALEEELPGVTKQPLESVNTLQ